MNSNHASAPFGQSWFERPWVPESLACGITALAYLATLWFGFVYDDVLQILQSPALHEWRYLPQYFTSHVLAALYPNAAGNYYRPLLMLWLRLNYVLFGPQPAGWHATTVLCHVLAAYLVFRLARQLTEDRLVAFGSALLFGLHPAHIESVAWISGVSDPLMACFFLGSLCAFLSYRESGKIWWAVISVAAFGLALLCKETAIVLPAVIMTWMLVEPRADGPHPFAANRIGTAITQSAAYLLVAILYLVVRLRALHGFSHPAIPLSWTEVFLTWPSVLWFYARHLLLPLRLSEFYSLGYVRHASAQTVVLPLLPLLALGLALYCWLRSLPQKQAAVLALALIALPLLPVLELRSLTVGDVVHDRYLYLPSVGFALLAAMAFSSLARRVAARHSLALTLALTGSVAVLYGALTVAQQTQWANNISLYSRGLESAPDNLTVRDNLANALLEANQPDRAIPLYLDVLKRNPNFWRSNYNLGYAYYRTGDYAAAENSLQRAIRIDSSDSDQYIYLALAQLQLKKLAQASDNARSAIARNPQARGYHFILGLIEEAAGDRPAAIAALKTELTLYPNSTPAAAELQKIQENATKPQP